MSGQQAQFKVVTGGRTVDCTLRARFDATETFDAHGWRRAIKDFLLDCSSRLEKKTVDYYQQRLKAVSTWMIESAREGDGVALVDFKASDMREYLAYRAECINPVTGKPLSGSTRRGDAVATNVFMEFCQREGYRDGDPLRDYALPKASRPHIKLPSVEDLQLLLEATLNRWDPKLNDNVKYIKPRVRLFFKRRSHALLSLLIDCGLRIEEALELSLIDYDRERMSISVRESKGDEPRVIPVSSHLKESLDAYLLARPNCKSHYLFVSEFGDRTTYSVMRKCFQKDIKFAAIPHLNFHVLRHYTITEAAKVNMRAAQLMAGHKNSSTTMIYLHADADHLRDSHKKADALGKVMVNKRSARQKETRKRVL